MTVTMRRNLASVAALASFAIAGALRSYADASPFLVAAFILLGILLGLWVGYSVVTGRGGRE